MYFPRLWQYLPIVALGSIHEVVIFCKVPHETSKDSALIKVSPCPLLSEMTSQSVLFCSPNVGVIPIKFMAARTFTGFSKSNAQDPDPLVFGIGPMTLLLVASILEYCFVDIAFCILWLNGCILRSDGVVICRTDNAARYIVMNVVDQKAAGTEYFHQRGS